MVKKESEYGDTANIKLEKPNLSPLQIDESIFSCCEHMAPLCRRQSGCGYGCSNSQLATVS